MAAVVRRMPLCIWRAIQYGGSLGIILEVNIKEPMGL